METVTAKFKLNSYTTEMHSSYPHKKENGETDYMRVEKVEKRTLNLTPVYSDKADDENRKFWDASPSGSMQLGVVNQEAWSFFELEKEYYLDFRKV